MNKIIVKSLNTMHSEITVEIDGNITKHIVNNNGGFNLKDWIKYFEEEYAK